MRVTSPIPRKKARIEIIPLIDIMFFLLASFMMVSLSQVHMKGIKVNLPTGVSGETQSKRDYISLSVDKDGNYYFDKQEVSYDNVLPLLQKVHQTDPEAKVFVRGDRDTMLAMSFGCLISCERPASTRSPLRLRARRPKDFRLRGRLVRGNFYA